MEKLSENDCRVVRSLSNSKFKTKLTTSETINIKEVIIIRKLSIANKVNW